MSNYFRNAGKMNTARTAALLAGLSLVLAGGCEATSPEDVEDQGTKEDGTEDTIITPIVEERLDVQDGSPLAVKTMWYKNTRFLKSGFLAPGKNDTFYLASTYCNNCVPSDFVYPGTWNRYMSAIAYYSSEAELIWTQPFDGDVTLVGPQSVFDDGALLVLESDYMGKLSIDGAFDWEREVTCYNDFSYPVYYAPSLVTLQPATLSDDLVICAGNKKQAENEYSVYEPDGFAISGYEKRKAPVFEIVADRETAAIHQYISRPDGTFIVLGYSGASLTLGAGRDNASTLKDSQFLAKFQRDGVLEWVIETPQTALPTTYSFMAELSNGDIIVAGSRDDDCDACPPVLHKYSKEGQFQWGRLLSGAQLQDVTVLKDDTVVLVAQLADGGLHLAQLDAREGTLIGTSSYGCSSTDDGTYDSALYPDAKIIALSDDSLIVSHHISPKTDAEFPGSVCMKRFEI